MMMREPRANVRSLLRVYLTAIMVCCIALAMRCLALGVDGLWLDEVYSASFASLAPIDLVIAALRFDLHPPLYYLQLAIWGVVSLDDNWLLANSIAWSIGTLLLAGYGVCRLTRSNYVAWLLVTLVVSVLGSEVYYASELRMYAMISFLTVLGSGLPHSNIIKASGQACSCVNHHPRQRLCAAGADWSSSFQAERAG